MTCYYVIQPEGEVPFLTAIDDRAAALLRDRLAVCTESKFVRQALVLTFGEAARDAEVSRLTSEEYFDTLRRMGNPDGGQPAKLPEGPKSRPPSGIRARALAAQGAL